MSYSFTRPVAEKANYSPNEYVNFKVHEPGRSILPGSVRLSGLLDVQHNGADITSTEEIFHDADLGFESIVNSSLININGSTVESVQDYNKMRKIIVSGNKTSYANASESDSNNRGSSGTKGDATRDKLLSQNVPSFSIKLDCCLNKSNMPIGSGKGPIQISVRLEQPVNVFHGPTPDATTTYTVSKLILEWRTVPEEPEHNKDLVMEAYSSVRQIINTNNQQISVGNSVPTNRVFACLTDTETLNDPNYNSMQMDEPSEGVKSVEWSINDSLAFEKFPFDKREEIVYNGLMAVNGKVNGMNCVTIPELEDKTKFIMGFQYYRYWEPNSKFGMNLQLDTAPLGVKTYTLFLYMAGVITV